MTSGRVETLRGLAVALAAAGIVQAVRNGLLLTNDEATVNSGVNRYLAANYRVNLRPSSVKTKEIWINIRKAEVLGCTAGSWKK